MTHTVGSLIVLLATLAICFKPVQSAHFRLQGLIDETVHTAAAKPKPKTNWLQIISIWQEELLILLSSVFIVNSTTLRNLCALLKEEELLILLSSVFIVNGTTLRNLCALLKVPPISLRAI
jgi:hypothetical protein